MTRLALSFVLLLASAFAAHAASWSEREVNLESGLFGTLTMPDGKAPVDAALILAGSGPTDRDGNFPSGRNNSLKLLAHALGERGIASLRIDKRGVGDSIGAAPEEEKLRAETYVEDAVRWLDLLEKEPRIRRIVALGHSEGALLATLAPERHEVAGLVLLTASGRPAPALIREQLAGNDLEPSLAARAEEILQGLEKGKRTKDVPPQLDMLYRPSVQPYLISWFKYDPAAELAKTDVPVLVVQGTRDLQQRPADGEKLAAAREGVTLVTIDNMNHVLKTAPEDRAGNMALYVDPHAPLAPGLADAIADFIGKMTEAPKP
ncbi:alpha/beta hydrolase [Parvibaculum sp.]|uniref:alpha/beta hydrolase n=1 Tax=Parvibaculum sp. TaxID=2024848 RepID=UPI003BAAB01D